MDLIESAVRERRKAIALAARAAQNACWWPASRTVPAGAPTLRGLRATSSQKPKWCPFEVRRSLERILREGGADHYDDERYAERLEEGMVQLLHSIRAAPTPTRVQSERFAAIEAAFEPVIADLRSILGAVEEARSIAQRLEQERFRTNAVRAGDLRGRAFMTALVYDLLDNLGVDVVFDPQVTDQELLRFLDDLVSATDHHPAANAQLARASDSLHRGEYSDAWLHLRGVSEMFPLNAGA